MDDVTDTLPVEWLERLADFFEDIPATPHRTCGAVNVSYGQPCHSVATKWLGDVPLCDRHVDRLLDRARAVVELKAAERAADVQMRQWQRERQRRGRTSVVYFLERDGFVKIGRTYDLDVRVRSISSGAGATLPDGMSVGPMAVLLTMPGGVELERRLHDRFAGLRYAGEWFLFDGELRRFVDEESRRTRDARTAHTSV